MQLEIKACRVRTLLKFLSSILLIGNRCQQCAATQIKGIVRNYFVMAHLLERKRLAITVAIATLAFHHTWR